MDEKLPFQVEPYETLAGVYNEAGFTRYTEVAVPQYIAYAQAIDWAGRRVIVLGSGTGISTWWLSQQYFRALGIDSSLHMIEQARTYVQAKVEELRQTDQLDEVSFQAPDFAQMDMRAFKSPIGLVDMVLSVGGTLNAVHSLRELEATFKCVHVALAADRLFIFDMRTIRGLADPAGLGDTVAYDNGFNLLITVRATFSYETLSNASHYTIYRQQALTEQRWTRSDEIHTTRGFPTQGVIALLERGGFEMVAVLNPDMTPFDPAQDPFGRVVFVARKP